MSILQAPRTPAAPEPVGAPVPYRSGDRVVATSPEGTRFRARVEVVTPTTDGRFTIVAAVTEPRRYRSHLLTAVVGADGYGPAIRPAR